jgi:hypothetical protein
MENSLVVLHLDGRWWYDDMCPLGEENIQLDNIVLPDDGSIIVILIHHNKTCLKRPPLSLQPK